MSNKTLNNTTRVRTVKKSTRLAVGCLLLTAITAVTTTTAQTQPTTAPSRVSASVDAPSVLAAPVGGPIKVTVNKSQVLTTRTPYTRVSVSQPEIADVNLVGANSILLTAKKPGGTQIVIWDENNRSQSIDIVVEQDLAQLQEQIKSVFPDAKIEVIGMGPDVAVRGRVPNLQTAEQIGAIAAPYGVKVLNFLEVSGGQQVMLKVRFMEVSRSAMKNLGFNLTSLYSNSEWSVGMNLSPAAVFDPSAGLTGTGAWGNFTFDAMIDALERNNLSRVLAQPNLTAISGQEATFLAGGEFPIPVPQASSTGGTTITIEYKEFGVRLKFVPIILGDGRIRLKVAPEVSDLDYANGVELSGFAIPAVTVRSLNTTVEMAEGQTLALGGLLNERVSATRTSTPGLGNLPIIGTLFRSVRYERNETELLVLVTPVFAEAMNPAQVPAGPGQHWRDPNDVELYFNGKLGTDGGDRSKAASDKAMAGPAPRYRGAYGYRDVSAMKSEPKAPTTILPTATPQPGSVMEPAPQASVEVAPRAPVEPVVSPSVSSAPEVTASQGMESAAIVEVTPVLSE